MYHLNIQHATIHMPPGQPLALGELASAQFVTGAAMATASNNDVQPPAYGERWEGQGGFYGGFWPAMLGLPARHLVFSELEAKLQYGGYGEDEPGAASRVDGRSNTAALIASAHDHPAAKWAANYHTDEHRDFHLPSQADLFMASLCAPQLFKKEGWYLSSTQGSRDLAFVQAFESGNSYWNGKEVDFRVRAVRWIHLNP